jgi:hypothetical protein
MSGISELDDLAASLAEQVSRYTGRDQFVKFATGRIRNGLRVIEERVESLAGKSEPKSPIVSYTEKGRREHRTHYLKSWTGYGSGCDVCGGGYDIQTFMSLAIGSHKARLSVDLCKTCARRLLNIIEARFDDRRRNGNAR